LEELYEIARVKGYLKGDLKHENVKLKWKTDEQNLAVQKKLMELNHKNESVAWDVSLTYGYDNCDYQALDFCRAVCSVWKGFRFWLLIRI